MNACEVMKMLIASLLLAASHTVFAQDLPRYIIPVNPCQIVPTLSDAELLERAIPIYYLVNSTTIQDDEPNYQRLIQELEQLQAKGYTPCSPMMLRGSSSPDGAYHYNQAIAAQRAKTLADSLARHMTLPAVVDEHHVAEDYAMLRQLMVHSSYPYSEEVIKVIDSHCGKPADTKNALRALKGGQVWRELLRHYYPKLRATRVVLFMQVPKQKEEPVAEQPLDKVVAPAEEAAKNEPQEIKEKPQTPISDQALEPLPPYEADHKQAKAVTQTRPMLNLKTNVLYDLALTPNVTLEFLPPGGHITVAAEWMWANWRNDSRHHTWVLQNILLEGRYYLKGNAAYTGHHFDLYAHAGKYDVQFGRTHGYQSLDFGKTWGAGIGWGYARRIGSTHWKWEVSAAVGYLHSPYDSYHAAEEWAQPGKWYYDYHGDPALFRAQSKRFNYFGPTRLGFSISYDIPWLGWKRPTDK